MFESDKNSAIGAGSNINFTLGWTSDLKAQIASTPVASFAGSTSMLYVPDTSSKYVDYVASDLGTKVTYDTSPNTDVAVVEYHSGQFYANLFVTVPGAAVSISGGTAGGVKTLGSVSVIDSEITSVSSKNLIVVGGSCVNTVAAKLLGSATPLCGADFTAKTGIGAGQALIKTYTSPYSSDKVATLVAGFNAGDTTMAAKYLITQAVDTTAGASGLVVTSETTATVQATTA